MGLTGQAATVDELLTGRENLQLIGRLYGLPKKYVRRARRRAARAVLADRRRRPDREDLLRRHAAAARPGGQPGRRPADPVPRRADHRARPAQPDRAVGGAPRAGPRRHDPAAHHAVPRGGRPAGRRDRRDRQRQGHRRRHRRPSSRTRPAGPASSSPSPMPPTWSAAERLLRTCATRCMSSPTARRLTAQAGGLGDMTRIAGFFDDQRHRGRRPRPEAPEPRRRVPAPHRPPGRGRPGRAGRQRGSAPMTTIPADSHRASAAADQAAPRRCPGVGTAGLAQPACTSGGCPRC